MQRDWSELELRLGERVLYRSREVDYEAHHVIPYRDGEAQPVGSTYRLLSR